MILWLLACGGTQTAEPPPKPPPTEVVLPAARDAERWGKALCNDGTPWGYTLRRGDPKLWVINLQGGFFCEDQRNPCADRPKRLTTTLPGTDGGPARFKQQGIFSTDPATNPTFAGATFVDAHYCSSDLWLGDQTGKRPNSASADGWYFNGRENVRVLLDALPALHGLDPTDPDTRVLLLGTSAGGAGVVGNLDQVATTWAPLTDGRVKVVLDGSWIPLQPEGTPLPDADRWGPVQPACTAAFTAAGRDPVDCIYGPNWWPHVQPLGIPILVQMSGLDKSLTPVFGVTTPETRSAWQARVRRDLEQLPWAFSGGHPYHVVAIEPLFGKGPDGRTFRDVLQRFWDGGEPEKVFFRYPETQ